MYHPGMKKIDKLISTSFIGPAVLSYFVATFVLIMQFLWKYIDEILGKGLSILEMSELIFYYAVTLIPMAVPITVLISSVMVFGDMAEKYELSSMKSAGISLLRIMVPGIVVALFISLFSLVASNYLKPASLLQFNKRFIAIRKQKTALAIEEGIFNSAFGETVIRVNRIDKDKRGIHDVLIYDHTPSDKSLTGLLSSKGGEMYTVEDGRFFVMKLDTGTQYRELEKKQQLGSGKRELPFMRIYFDEWTKTFDMSQFDLEEGLLNFNRNREDMMNTVQLLKSIDSFRTHVTENRQKISSRMDNFLAGNVKEFSESSPVTGSAIPSNIVNKEREIPQVVRRSVGDADSLRVRDSLRKVKEAMVRAVTGGNMPKKTVSAIQKTSAQKPPDVPLSPISTIPAKKLVKQKKGLETRKLRHFGETIDSADFRDVMVRAQSDLSRDRDEILNTRSVNSDLIRSYEKYMLRLNQQYSWAMVCIVFLFIGAPLGSIIRKGGYGYPMLVAILFYMIFIISTIFGEKLVKNETMGGLLAAWLPCLLLIPFAILLTFLALRDTKMNISFPKTWIQALVDKKNNSAGKQTV